MNRYTLDFEASCLPHFGRSYPIEVAVCDVEHGKVSSWLIRPSEEWAGWDWDPAAEHLHGISHERLMKHGRRPFDVVFELNGLLRGAEVVSDSGLDEVWLIALSDAARIDARFEILPFDIALEGLALAPGAEGQAQIEAAQHEAHRKHPRIHRASADARRLAEVLRILTDCTAAAD